MTPTSSAPFARLLDDEPAGTPVSRLTVILRLMEYRSHTFAHGPCFLVLTPREDLVEGLPARRTPRRFIQFSFEKDCFHLDIPRIVLARGEAEQIRSERQGFFYLAEGPEFTLHQEDVEGHHPFRTVYFYGDERAAAEDTAYILFRVWELPLSCPLAISAAAFSGKYHWEHDEIL